MSRAYDFIERKDLEYFADRGIRHKRNATADDFLDGWLRLFRPTAYATRDSSWGELEKCIAIFFAQAILSKRFVREIFRREDMREITPKMIEAINNLIEKNCERCSCMTTHHPGQLSYSPDELCPKCDGTGLIDKQKA